MRHLGELKPNFAVQIELSIYLNLKMFMNSDAHSPLAGIHY